MIQIFKTTLCSRLISGLIILNFLSVGLTPSGFSFTGQSEDFGTFNILINELISLDTASPKRVIVRDPEVVEVVKVSNSTVEVMGKAEGKTDVTIYDGEGIRTYTISVYGEDLVLLREKIKELLYKRIGLTTALRFHEDEVSHKLIIMGELFEDDMKKVAEALKPVEKFIVNYITPKKRDELVKIDVQVLEIDMEAMDKLGFDWIDRFRVREEEYNDTANEETGTTLLDQIKEANVVKGHRFDKLFRINEISRDAVILTFYSMIQEGKGRILSRPQLICASGEEANVVIGGEVPIDSSTSTDQGTTTSTSYKEYGIRMKIKPQVLPDERIRVNVNTEISEIDDDNTLTTGSGKKFAFFKRNATTNLLLNDGETILIAGMIENQESTSEQKVPFLGDIPWAGALFRYKDKTVRQREVIISISTEIINVPVLGAKPASAVEARTPVEAEPMLMRQEETDNSVYRIPDNTHLGYQHARQKQEYMPQAVTNYIYTVQKIIIDSLVDPPVSEDPAWESSMKLRLHLLSDGTLSDVQVLEHSGYRIFDDFVLNKAQKINPYPYFPTGMTQDDIWLEIPIIYAARKD